MSYALLLLATQILTAAAWALACICLSPSLWRSLRGRERAGDEWRSALFFLGLVVAFGTSGRAAGAVGPAWLVIYSLLTTVAGYALLLLWNGRRR